MTESLVKEIFDEFINPAVAQDGGQIEFIKILDNFVYVKLLGSCNECLSSTVTLQLLVNQLLAETFPEYKGLCVDE